MDLNTRVNWLLWQRLYGWPILRSVSTTLVTLTRDRRWRNGSMLGMPMLALTDEWRRRPVLNAGS